MNATDFKVGQKVRFRCGKVLRRGVVEGHDHWDQRVFIAHKWRRGLRHYSALAGDVFDEAYWFKPYRGPACEQTLPAELPPMERRGCYRL